MFNAAGVIPNNIHGQEQGADKGAEPSASRQGVEHNRELETGCSAVNDAPLFCVCYQVQRHREQESQFKVGSVKIRIIKESVASRVVSHIKWSRQKIQYKMLQDAIDSDKDRAGHNGG